MSDLFVYTVDSPSSDLILSVDEVITLNEPTQYIHNLVEILCSITKDKEDYVIIYEESEGDESVKYKYWFLKGRFKRYTSRLTWDDNNVQDYIGDLYSIKTKDNVFEMRFLSMRHLIKWVENHLDISEEIKIKQITK